MADELSVIIDPGYSEFLTPYAPAQAEIGRLRWEVKRLIAEREKDREALEALEAELIQVKREIVRASEGCAEIVWSAVVPKPTR